MNLDPKSHWYKNCKRRRKEGAKICQECPFRSQIEEHENAELGVTTRFVGEGFGCAKLPVARYRVVKTTKRPRRIYVRRVG